MDSRLGIRYRDPDNGINQGNPGWKFKRTLKVGSYISSYSFGAQVSLCVSELMIIGKVEILNELRAIDWVMFIEIHHEMNICGRSQPSTEYCYLINIYFRMNGIMT